jgi:hypothetical protein
MDGWLLVSARKLGQEFVQLVKAGLAGKQGALDVVPAPAVLSLLAITLSARTDRTSPGFFVCMCVCVCCVCARASLRRCRQVASHSERKAAMFTKFSAALLAAAAASTYAAPQSAPPSSNAAPSVTLPDGPVVGFTSDGVDAYRGIPYAAAPIGDNRLRPPQPVVPWTAPRDATQFGASCLQRGSTGTNTFQPNDKAWNTINVTLSSEDCLFVNVYTPRSVGVARCGRAAFASRSRSGVTDGLVGCRRSVAGESRQ